MLPEVPDSTFTFSGLPLYLILPPELASADSFLRAYSLILAPELASATALSAVSDEALILAPELAS